LDLATPLMFRLITEIQPLKRPSLEPAKQTDAKNLEVKVVFVNIVYNVILCIGIRAGGGMEGLKSPELGKVIIFRGKL